jgi:putative membrane protein
MPYLWFKAFHIIGVVVWFAGLFYLGRLFVYHAEASQEPEIAQAILKKQYQIMEKRLFGIITTPGMWVTVIMAGAMLTVEPSLLKSGWLHIKLLFVLLLVGYHHFCRRLMRQLENNTCTWTGQNFRAFNEAPTLLLVIIVLLVVFKGTLPLSWTTGLIIALIVSMVAAIQLYAKKRKQNQDKLAASQ